MTDEHRVTLAVLNTTVEGLREDIRELKRNMVPRHEVDTLAREVGELRGTYNWVVRFIVTAFIAALLGLVLVGGG